MEALESKAVEAAVDAVVLRLCQADAWASSSARQVAAVNSESRFGLPFLSRIEFWMLEELEPLIESDADVLWVFNNWRKSLDVLSKRVVAKAYARLREVDHA